MENGESDVSKQKRRRRINSGNDEVAPTVVLPKTVDEMRQIVELANAGNESVLPQVRELLEIGGQVAIEVLRCDLVQANENLLIRQLAGDNDAHYLAIKRKAELKREELAGPNPSPIESMLIDTIVICWLQTQRADGICMHLERMPLAEAEFHERARDRAHRRLLSAIKTLATVRKSVAPSMQVNIANRQVNMNVAQQTSLEATPRRSRRRQQGARAD